MKPAEKYMTDFNTNNTEFKFTPPSFNSSLFRDGNLPEENDTTTTKNNTDNNENLFPSETESSQLFCYYSSFNDCVEKNSNLATHKIPTPSEILKNLDLDSDELEYIRKSNHEENISNIYEKIESENPNILSTFSAYGIPHPIEKVIVKRLIKLSIMYNGTYR